MSSLRLRMVALLESVITPIVPSRKGVRAQVRLPPSSKKSEGWLPKAGRVVRKAYQKTRKAVQKVPSLVRRGLDVGRVAAPHAFRYGLAFGQGVTDRGGSPWGGVAGIGRQVSSDMIRAANRREGGKFIPFESPWWVPASKTKKGKGFVQHADFVQSPEHVRAASEKDRRRARGIHKAAEIAASIGQAIDPA